VPFDYSFDLDDSALYCLEMTEKAFRSQGLALSEPVRLGDMENANRYPICMSLFVSLSPHVLKKPITLEQAVYMPGNGRHGVWASPLLEAVYSPTDDRTHEDIPGQEGRFSLSGDLAIVAGIVSEFRISDRLRSQRETQFGLGSPASRDAVVSASLKTASASDHRGIGVLGDSYSDEYQFSSPDRSTARNWIEILSLTRGLDFGRFNSSGWGGPRGRGFEYNWARSDATSGDLIASGQHTGLAAQVARGDVRMVFVLIGGNDFINAMYAPAPEAAVKAALPRALANYQLVIRTIRAANPDVRLVLATVPDIRLLPEFDQPLREGRLPVRLADACTAAMQSYNAQIRAMSMGDPRIALLDLALVARIANLVSRDYAIVAGKRLDRSHPGNSRDRFFLADGRHPGTLAQAQLARLFILGVNARFGAGIEPLSDGEIVGLFDASVAGRPGSSPSRSGVRETLGDPAEPGQAGHPGLGRGAASLAQ
jgi:lysophospholipase L1-like esterase